MLKDWKHHDNHHKERKTIDLEDIINPKKGGALVPICYRSGHDVGWENKSIATLVRKVLE